MSLAAALRDAFLATTYTADTPAGRFAMRIGERHAALDAWLATMGLAEWSYLTACNPDARRLDAVANAVRQAALRRELAALGYAVHDGAGVPDAPGWEPEPSVLVPGLTLANACEVAQRHGQLALVCGRRGEAAVLVEIGTF